MRDQGKLTRIPLAESVWQQVAQDPAGPAAALARLGAVLLLERERPGAWPGTPDGIPGALATLRTLLEERLGAGHPVPLPEPGDLTEALPQLADGLALAREDGPQQAFAFLLGRQLEAAARHAPTTPAGTAGLMAALAGPAAHVLDPACGPGGLLAAAATATVLGGRELDPEQAALAALRLALGTRARVRIRTGDSLREDALLWDAGADAVLCHPPFNERHWGHEELAYDPRWEYGLPPRTESELAWVQHALAHLRPGGRAVLLLPPAVAARRSGRRIRADLVRRGALRAVVALPAGAAAPHGIPLHLWVLGRPEPGAAPPQQVLLVETAGLAGQGWPELQRTVTGLWAEFSAGRPADRPGTSRAVPVVELLDEDVDITPARFLPPPAAAGSGPRLAALHEELTAALTRAARLVPPVPEQPAPTGPATTVGDLVRAGALTVHSGTAAEPTTTRPGDVVVPVLGTTATVRVVDAASAGVPLDRTLQLLRPDPNTLDPWFLAGVLRSTAASRRASSYTSTATRLDLRRLEVPRLPPAEQRRHGELARAVAEFEQALEQAAELGRRYGQALHDGGAEAGAAPG
ncbi:N-6 DNA methylase [Streptacidiphilus monticola]